MSNSYISVARVRVIFVFIALTLFSQPSFVEPKTESLLIFGDSISAGYGMSKDKQWSEELKKILDKCKIAHLDINDNGKNICINQNGIISLIDFDIIHFIKLDTLDNLTPLMLDRIRKYNYCYMI